MSNYVKKICPELLKIVLLNNIKQENDCVIYTKDFLRFKKELEKLNKKYFEYPFISAFGTKLNQDQIVKFAKTGIVSFISKQASVSALINVSKKIMAIDSFYTRNIFGEDVTLAIIDTGISSHLDFCLPKNRILKFVDLINNKTMPYDDNGHGTFVASIACGNGLISNKKYSGVSPKTNIISIKALEKNGETGAFKILEAMQWIYDNKKKYNIKVVCMSFGSNPMGKNDPLVLGAEALWNSGIVVVAAAGNSGPETETIKSPGQSGKIITVGGINDNRYEENFNLENFEIAKFSSRGPAGNFFKPDIVAPAVNITGANFKGDFYSKMSGTSVATPMIAGISCLIFSKYPSVTPDQLKIRLLRNCQKMTQNQNEEGFGLANLEKFFS